MLLKGTNARKYPSLTVNDKSSSISIEISTKIHDGITDQIIITQWNDWANSSRQWLLIINQYIIVLVTNNDKKITVDLLHKILYLFKTKAIPNRTRVGIIILKIQYSLNLTRIYLLSKLNPSWSWELVKSSWALHPHPHRTGLVKYKLRHGELFLSFYCTEVDTSFRTKINWSMSMVCLASITMPEPCFDHVWAMIGLTSLSGWI